MKTQRIYGFDFARAFAILGMMFVNYKIVFTQEIVAHESLNQFLSVFEGRAAAVFLVLAGLGIGLMTRSGYLSSDPAVRRLHREMLLKRALFLLILGLALYYFFDWSADILHYYGVYMVAVSLFIYLKTSTIVLAGLLTTATGTALQLLLDYTHRWDLSFTSYEGFWTVEGFISNTFFNGYHPFFPWFAFILFGLALSRMDFTQKQKVLFLTSRALIIAVLLEALSAGLIALMGGSETAFYLFDTKPMNPTFLYIVTATAWAMFFIGGSVLLEGKVKTSRWFQFIVKGGQMALTHYVIHAVVVLGVMTVIDNLAYRDEVFVFFMTLFVFLSMLVFSNGWGLKFRKGPLELVMRRMTQ